MISTQISTTSNKPAYRICTQTVMDTSDPNITFDKNGVCNHYWQYQEQVKKYLIRGDAGLVRLKQTAERISKIGKGCRYDCILGLSGGVDSTYLCLLAKQYGLRPLIVHFDNGWNSELAVNNIENTVKRLQFDLHTHVCDWEEFRDLQRSYFKANVVDIEVLTDHGFMAALYQQARKHRIKFVLAGMNVVTEAILPDNWIFPKGDLTNILNIHRRFGRIPVSKLRSYPMLDPDRRAILDKLLRLEFVTPLNYVQYDYDHVKRIISDELGWREYGGKHYESVFTRFYQGYILPTKFGFDKRRAHLSTLICSGQMNRDDALAILERPGYDPEQYRIDRPFVLKKLGFSEAEFDHYIKAPRVEHKTYGTHLTRFRYLRWLRPARRLVGRILAGSRRTTT